MSEVRRRSVGANWTWFEDYIFLTKKWTASCPPNRQVQVGMGVSVGGTPRGEKIRFSGLKEFTTWGAGSIHFRVTDGRGPCEVVLYSGKSRGIPILRVRELVTAGAIESENSSPSGDTSRFDFATEAEAGTIEAFNELLRSRGLDVHNENADADERIQALTELEARAAELQDEFFAIRNERHRLRRLAVAAESIGKQDLGSDCDGDRCHTEKRNEPIGGGETDVYVHDDQDRGSVNVRCESGEIEVVLSTAIWSTFNEYDRKRLAAGQVWKRDIASQSSWFDQTNRVEIVGKTDAVYNLDFKSWDD